jgi:hypothetical protein
MFHYLRFSSEAESTNWAPPPIHLPRTSCQQNCATSFQDLVYKPPNNHQAHRVDLTPPCFVPGKPCDLAFISLQHVGCSSALSALQDSYWATMSWPRFCANTVVQAHISELKTKLLSLANIGISEGSYFGTNLPPGPQRVHLAYRTMKSAVRPMRRH